MTTLTPDQMARKAARMAAEVREARRKEVVVGLPRGEAASKIYGNGTTVLEVGMAHEYGEGTAPQRSFLEVPFLVKADALEDAVEAAWRRVEDGHLNTVGALDLIGIFARNVSVDAFSNDGYGYWQPLDAETVRRKGSSAPLINTGTLRNSITWEVRNAT